jgi:hypothetical protein
MLASGKQSVVGASTRDVQKVVSVFLLFFGSKIFCSSGDENGPSSSSCESWFFERCYTPGVEIVFSGSYLVFGLTSSIGGGLVLACVSVLAYFLVRGALRMKVNLVVGLVFRPLIKISGQTRFCIVFEDAPKLLQHV